MTGKKMVIICRLCIDFEDLKGNRFCVFVIFPHVSQIESEESEFSNVFNTALATLCINGHGCSACEIQRNIHSE